MTIEEWKKGKIYQLRKVDGVVIGIYVDPEESMLTKQGKKRVKETKRKEK